MIFSVHTSRRKTSVTVWIVMKNGKVDAVFDTEAAAEIHKKNAQRGWNMTAIVQKEVYTL